MNSYYTYVYFVHTQIILYLSIPTYIWFAVCTIFCGNRYHLVRFIIPLPALQHYTFGPQVGSRPVQGRCKYNRELKMWTKGGMRIIRPYYHLWSACSPWSHERVPVVSTPPSFARSFWRQGPNEGPPDSFIKISKEQVNDGKSV